MRANSMLVTSDLLRLALQPCVVILCFLSLLPISPVAYQIHISHRDLPKTLLFKAGLHHDDWTYHLDQFRTSEMALKYVSIDSTEGSLFLKEVPAECSQHSTLKIYIIARHRQLSKYQRVEDNSAPGISQNSDIISSFSDIHVVIPVNMFIHSGKQCPDQVAKTYPHLSPLSVIATTSHHYGACIMPHQPVLKVLDFIPAAMSTELKQECQFQFYLHDTDDFYVHNTTSRIHAFKKVCVHEQISIQGKLTLNGACGIESLSESGAFQYVMPFTVTIRKAKQSVPTMKVVGDAYISSLHNLHARLRRAATNTKPTFQLPLYERHIDEEQAPGVLVATITATDPDSGDAGRLTYTLQATRDGRSRNMFAINPVTGRVNTTQKLDRETMTAHYFHVIVSDYGRPQETATTSLVIYVDDVNDHPPKFENDNYTQPVEESISIGSTLITVRATDQDTGDNSRIRYRILNPSGPNDVFSMDPEAGSIVLRTPLDREVISSYIIKVQAVDQGAIASRKSATATIQIQVLDQNDNRPQFTESSYHEVVREDTDPSGKPVIATVSAKDKDIGENGDVRYRITSGNTDNTFSIDSITGAISLLKPLDHEVITSYRLYIRAQDNGSPPKTNITTLLVDVQDVNDNNPKFTASSYLESIKEDVGVNYSILPVEAYDDDSGLNAELVYRIVDPPPGMPITVDPKTGWIKTNGQLDREQARAYNFLVEVRDKGNPPRSATATVDIHVTDVNDNPPIFNPRVYYASVSEEATPGVRVTSVTAIDKDERENARLTYDITSGNIDEAFRIYTQGGEGIISVARVLNYKQQSRYILTVRGSDPGGKVDTATVFINITDTNRHRPMFQNNPYQKDVDENVKVGTVLIKVFALDNDVGENARVTYSISGEGSQVFSIDANTGEIRTRLPLNRETTAGYVLTVTATDHGKPPMSDVTDVEINVRDNNDNAPEFQETLYSGRISEGATVGDSVIQITASDLDIGKNGQIFYTFDSGNDGNGDFEIDRTLGIIRTAKKLDREKVANYKLIAFAVDMGVPPKSTSVAVNVEIEDINDSAPMFESEVINVYIKENSPRASTVGRISATDPDEGSNAQIEYSIQGGPDADSFHLTERPGEPAIITTKVDLDYESSKKMYELIIKAASTPHFSTAKVKIWVQDVNDNRPKLNDFTIILNNFLEHFPSGPIGKVPAHDPDEYDVLHYSFLSGNEANLLYLNSSTGEIRLDWRLNSDVPRNGTFLVKVTDGKNEVQATCKLYVRLVTADMLQNSVTIRLNNMTQPAFLSPLFKFFVDALANIFQTEERNIFVINIQDDTDVSTQVLNVSVSVRKSTDHGRDVFHSPQYLQEQIYLQRILLASLSTLQVLPFDDNMCVKELCAFFDYCQSALVFGQASPFISSTTMLFRPIHPSNWYQCHCPVGFTGMKKIFLCDVEVNLCYSSPCGGNGTCVQKEGGYTCLCQPGFTGKNCEIDMKTKKYDRVKCPSNVCMPPSYCEPLIKGGFRCEKCPESEFFNEFCQLTARSFPRGSYLTFPSLKSRHRFTIELKFATWERNGLLFYNGRYNEQHDFIALEIVDSQVQFSFSTGSNVTSVRTNLEEGTSNGEWHYVRVDYLNRTATLTVGEDCDTEVWIRYGHKLGNYTCAVRKTFHLEKRCNIETEPCHRLLDLTGPFQIGGLPSVSSDFQVKNKHFEGCIRDIYFDRELLDLNTPVADNGTQEGCPPKRSLCQSSPCTHRGTCREGWGTYICECPPRTGGKDCSQEIELPYTFRGDGYMMFKPASEAVQFVWYNGIAFRTRAHSGILMSVQVRSSKKIQLEIKDGFVSYTFDTLSVVLDKLRVNDGKWHYVVARWSEGQLIFSLDYGVIQKTIKVTTLTLGILVENVFVGGLDKSVPNLSGFVGCLKNVVLGSTERSTLSGGSKSNIVEGCNVQDACNSDPCSHGQCVDEWGKHSCQCSKGRMGPECGHICDDYNPCRHYAECQRSLTMGASQSYSCECGALQSGKYCEIRAQQPCPASWWGSPICGPCNCPTERGFKPSCNKTTGLCTCKVNHYKPKGSNTCYPCDCNYPGGARGLSCHPESGQCPCKSGIQGRRCDLCEDPFAEIRNGGCESVKQFDSCPRSYHSQVWWDRTLFNRTAVQDCPEDKDGSIPYGDAKRFCSRNGWLEPDLFNCTSEKFMGLQRQLGQLAAGVNTFLAKTTVSKLANISGSVDVMYGNDIYLTYLSLKTILSHENQQQGLNLTSERDRQFIPNILSTLSRMYDPKTKGYWDQIHRMSGGAIELMWMMEEYLSTLASSMATAHTWPFDVVSDCIVLAVDTIKNPNSTKERIPKYNNIVQKENMFDKLTYITLPASIIPTTAAKDSKAYVGYMMYKTLGEVLPTSYSSDVRTTRPLAVNSPVITVILRDKSRNIHGPLQEPVEITFQQLQVVNRTSPQCVHWQFKESGNNTRGQWSTEGCELKGRYKMGDKKFVTCSCNHLSTYAVLMDVSDTEYYPMEFLGVIIVRYIGFLISLTCLMICLLLFCCLRRLYSNSNSIHINFVLTIFVAELTFLVGIDKTENKLGCRFVAIILHYFYVSAFFWLFVEMLHLYRMLTEIRNINQGSMKFYYLLGYVVPGIIVSLAVGLATDDYGNDKYCWLATDSLLIASFIGPIGLIAVMNLFVFFMAVKASCSPKKEKAKVGFQRLVLVAAVLLLFVLVLDGVFGLLSVSTLLTDNHLAFHYLFAVITCFQGIFVLVAYVVCSKQVRFEMRRWWRICQGEKDFDEKYDAMKSPTASHRSALAYRHESFENGLNRINVGISTTSTTSRSTSKTSSGTGGYKNNYLRNSSTSTSGHVPSGSLYPPNTGIPPYGYDPAAFQRMKHPDDPDTGENDRKRTNDSDSDSDMSVGRHSLELASSHSSDEDDDYDGPKWEQQLPKNKILEEAIKRKEEKQKQRSAENVLSPHPYRDHPEQPSDPGTRQPDLLNAAGIRTGSERVHPPDYRSIYGGPNQYIVPPVRKDSLPPLNKSESSENTGSNRPPSRERTTVQVLTHNGSVTSSDSESSNETTV
ncbi:LOW QUALITY PROTEIN: cadherin EGF LAG seven-pass G-type receptor 2-like [Liolophura sinensis]|uniref:LOW QUALITY PROTEIN: cadherin EGF LAG seven-pass G-type receptor 2-like n=1 Tax=Liolophura sinensis TaxID=3198878 RepID=UPI0031580A66